jgi:ribosomal protein S18 acetylase RimI-like enzyme
MTRDFNIRKISPEDFLIVRDLPPPDWNFNYADFLKVHFPEKYFYAVVTFEGSEITGTGNALDFGESGWLGNIIVKPDYRRQGIGLFITQHLCRYLTGKGCKTILLLASDEGKSVYESAGFKNILKYRYFTSENKTSYQIPKEIRKIDKADLEAVYKLDLQVTGENRHYLISRFYENGWVYTGCSSISGFYLPDFGRGTIIASDRQAGLKLLELKHSMNHARSGVPVENIHAIRFFENNHFKENPSCTRMMRGRTIVWNPQNIYSYAHGYCG